jgi:signal peptidase I
LKDATVVLAAAVGAALFLHIAVLEAYRIPSRSMEPSLQAGDFLLVNKLFYAPHRGEVVVFRTTVDPGRGEMTLVKRCLAVPGDSVAMAEGVVWVNGARADSPGGDTPPTVGPSDLGGVVRTWVIPRKGDTIHLQESSLSTWQGFMLREGHRVTLSPLGEVLVDEKPSTTYNIEHNHYFVVGDNRSDSYDSRYWGLISEEEILGKALIVYWSWDESASAHSICDRFAAVRWRRIGMLVH